VNTAASPRTDYSYVGSVVATSMRVKLYDETRSRVVSDRDAAFVADHDGADPVAMLEYREHLVWETWIQIEMATVSRASLAAAAHPMFVDQYLD
jgi:hypothetical protein